MPDSDDQFEAKSNHGPLRALWSSKRWLIIAVAGGCLTLVTAAVTMLLSGSDQGPTLHEHFLQALMLLDAHDDLGAAENAKELATADYHDPDFGGGVQFILGMLAFRDAQSQSDEAERDNLYMIAVRELTKADRSALVAERRPEWAFALGTSLYHIGSANDARPLLEESVQSYQPGQTAAQLLLADVYLIPSLKTQQFLSKALELNDAVLAVPDLTTDFRGRAYLQRAQIFLALDKTTEAHAALAELDRLPPDPADVSIVDARKRQELKQILRARLQMAEGNFAEAQSTLKAAAASKSLDQTYVRQAQYLLGVCYENLGMLQEAIAQHLKTAKTFVGTEEALAANLRAADLLRREVGRNEEARQSYRIALGMVRRPEDFQNRWLSLESFRTVIRNAWDEWVAKSDYDESIRLSEMMSPLLPIDEAYERAALASELWAKNLDRRLQAATFTEQTKRRKELLELWEQSGEAYGRLAQARRTTALYPEALWISADHYRRGHDFNNALNQLTRFINTRPKDGMAQAWTEHGRVLMDLDRHDEAIEDFHRVIETYPKDSVSFEARILLGQCHLERDEYDNAQKIWTQILSSDLKPTAVEWRQALFLLGRLLYHTAVMRETQAQSLQATESSPEQQKLMADAFGRWDDCTRRLEEFLERYPDAPQGIEARYLLAKALINSAELPTRKLELAETENARMELRENIRRLLNHAVAEFEQLQQSLIESFQNDALGALGQRILRNCYFEIAHTHFNLGNYNKAIFAYNVAANKFPQDPQVLLAYVQMTNCYDHLGQPADARSLLEQAKVILDRLPDDVFDSRTTSMSKSEWDSWLKRIGELHQSEKWLPQTSEIEGALEPRSSEGT